MYLNLDLSFFSIYGHRKSSLLQILPLLSNLYKAIIFIGFIIVFIFLICLEFILYGIECVFRFIFFQLATRLIPTPFIKRS